MFRPRILIPLLVALAARAAVVSPEVPVSAPIYGAASGDQTTPAIASDGNEFLAVWSDERSGVHATRLTRTGEILDGTGIPLGGDGVAAVVWSGSSYVVVWSQIVWSAGPAIEAVVIARVDRDGSVIERPRILVEGAHTQTPRFLATNGSRIAVAYQRKREGGLSDSLHLALLDTDGRLIDGDIPIPTRAAGNYALTVTSNGSDFFAVWTAVTGPDATLDSVRIRADGTLLDAVPRILAHGYGPAAGPLVASDGRDYLLFRRDITKNELLAIPIGADGDPNGSPRPVPARPEAPAVTWTGSSYLLAWADLASSSIVGVHLDARGIPLGEPRTLGEWETAGLVSHVATGAAGGDVLVAWNDNRHSGFWYDVVGTIVQGSVVDPEPPAILSVSAPAQWEPSVASGGAHSLVLWHEESGLYAARLDAGGRSAGGRGMLLSPQDAFSGSSSVVFDGRRYLAAWTESADDESAIRTAILSPETGAPLAGHGTTIPACARDLRLATGADRLLVWSTCDGSISAVRIDEEGRSIDPVPLLLSRGADPRIEPAAAWSGSAWLITWVELFDQADFGPSPGFYLQARIVGARVSAALTLLDPEPLRLAEGRPARYSDPAVASDGTGFAVAWRNTFESDSDAPVEVAYLGADGSLGSPVGLGTGRDPAIVWDGSRFLVVWDRGGSGDLVGVVLSPGGMPSEMIEIAASGNVERSPSLTMSGPRRARIAYTRIATEPLYGSVPRVFTRAISGASRARSVRR